MSATYTGVPGNITPASAVDITEPADGDGLNVASVNGALSELTDYAAFLKRAAYDGTHSVKKLLVDGTGNVANGSGGGTIVASGAIATTGGNITADTGNVGATLGGLFWKTGYVLAGTVTTTDATVTTVGTYTLAANKAVYLDVTVVGRKDDTTCAIYRKWAAWCEEAGVSSLMSAGDIHAEYEDDATWGGLDMNGGATLAVNVTVEGKAATTIAWSVTIVATTIT